MRSEFGKFTEVTFTVYAPESSQNLQVAEPAELLNANDLLANNVSNLLSEF